MIEFCKSWCEGIVVAVIISIMIEAILPEGNHKKYVKVVIGIYIIFTILDPFLGKLNTEIEFTNQLDLSTIETATIDTTNIQELYTNGIKETLKNTIEEKFACTVQAIEILYDANYENIEKINLVLQTNGVSQIDKVEIGNQAPKQESENYKEIKKYISENYGVDENKIFMN